MNDNFRKAVRGFFWWSLAIGLIGLVVGLAVTSSSTAKCGGDALSLTFLACLPYNAMAWMLRGLFVACAGAFALLHMWRLQKGSKNVSDLVAQFTSPDNSDSGVILFALYLMAMAIAASHVAMTTVFGVLVNYALSFAVINIFGLLTAYFLNFFFAQIRSGNEFVDEFSQSGSNAVAWLTGVAFVLVALIF